MNEPLIVEKRIAPEIRSLYTPVDGGKIGLPLLDEMDSTTKPAKQDFTLNLERHEKTTTFKLIPSNRFIIDVDDLRSVFNNDTDSDKIKRGADGLVIFGEDQVNGERVAVKLLKPMNIRHNTYQAHVDEREMAQDFYYIANAVKDLSHRYLVKVYDTTALVDPSKKIIPAMILEKIDGIDGLEFMSQFGKSNEQVREAQIAKIILQVAEALDYLHTEGIVHGDIKPGNFMLRGFSFDRNSRVQAVVTDFGGIYGASVIKRNQRFATFTKGYASPELFYQTGKEGPWSDQYSLAVMAYELLLTSALSKKGIGFNPESKFRFSQDLISELDYSEDVKDILAIGTSTNPIDRFGSCKEFATFLSTSLKA